MGVLILRHESRLLRDNPCGDPHDRDVWFYLPPGYRDSGLRYPVLWCLTGFTGTGAMAVTGNRWSPGLPDRLDRLIADGMPPVIVAFPDCFTRWGGSQYLNSAATGPYEDYLCDELVAFADKELRTIPDRSARGVFGKSSGGYGALRLGMRRADLFSAVACHSGDMAFSLCYVPGFARTVARFAEAGSVEAWVERFESTEKKKGPDFDAINTMGMAAAYSPDPGCPFGIRFPFDLETGELDADVWRRWRKHDPIEMVGVKEHADALKSLSMLFLDCGSQDEWQLHLGLNILTRRMIDLKIAFEAEQFPDNHRSLSYRYDASVPKLVGALTPAG